MGAGGYILGGLLQGIGRGQEMSILQARQDALEELRNKRAIEAEGRADQRTQASEARAEIRQADRDERLYGQKKDLLTAGSEAKVTEIRAKGEEDRRSRATDYNYDVALEKVKNKLDVARDEASIRLRSQLDTGSAWLQQTRNGEMVIIDRDGNVTPTGVKGEKKELSGASIEARAEARRNYDSAVASAKRNGTPPPSLADYGLGDDEEESSGNSSDGTAWYAPNARPSKPARPKVGQVQDGYVYIGGDPKQQSSWSKTR